MNKVIKDRLTKPRKLTAITIRIPTDVIDSLKQIAPKKGFSGYQALLKSYVAKGLRDDEQRYLFSESERLAFELRQLGVDDKILKQALERLM